MSLTETTRQRNIKIIGSAYASIRLEDFANATGLSATEAQTLAKGLKDWKVENNVVYPQPAPKESVKPSASEDQLGQLTNFISFLEK